MPPAVVTATHGLRVDIIRNRQELAAYADGWNELLADSRANSIFLTWQWIDSWLDVVYPDAPLLTVVISDQGGKLLGIAPLYRSKFSFLGRLPVGCLRILGDRHTGGEYPDFILRHGHEARALHAILRALLGHKGDWHCIWLSKMAGWTGTYGFLRDACSQLGLPLRDRMSGFAAMDLPDNYDAWMDGLSRNRRSNLRRKTNRLFAEHKVEHIRPEGPEELPEFLEALFTLHHKHWASVGKPSSFDRSPHKKPFYYRLAAEALRQGWLQMDALKVDGQIKAVQYGYLYHGTLFSVQEGYDPEAYDGIGNVLRHIVIQRAIEDGVREYDFLAGFSEHKQRWGGQRRVGYDLLIGRPCVRTKLLLGPGIWPTGRFLRQGKPL